MVIDKRNTRSNDVQNILPRKVRQKCVIGQVGTAKGCFERRKGMEEGRQG